MPESYYAVQEINRFEIEVTKVNILEDTGIFYTRNEIKDMYGECREGRIWSSTKFDEAVIEAIQPLLLGEKKSIPIPPEILDQIEKRYLNHFVLIGGYPRLKRRKNNFILQNIKKISESESVLPKPKNPWKIDLLNLVVDAANAYYTKVIKEHDLPTTEFRLNISKKITHEELIRVFQYYKLFLTFEEIMEYVKKLPKFPERRLRLRDGPQEYFYETLYKNPEQIIKQKSKA